ncbi:hypothetical protein GIB67_006139 [Kingdonia uniflora]|uniref:RNA-dependent RNA polymerase n=1 Tax=Kingdonia uniflora TaxID=39325 RepID=A0A7J7LPU0_9MAGN|nr:hypothetical protein GIB67_006139 [Kingdonia uniflora]
MGKTIQVYGFPSDVSADAVKVFLESYTGDGTVYALKVRQTNLNSRAFAVVQFTTAHITDFVASMINQRLYYGNSYLKVRDMERDIVPKPKASMHTLEVTAMNMGCQVSNERFFVLWKCNNVLVKFGFLSRKVEFFLRHCNVEYKLEFSFGNIWQIQLRRPRMLNTQFLVIQVLAAPRIYEKSSVSSGNIYEDPALNYFRDTPVDQWVRATDFTTSSFIGQSSAICLELPNSCELPCIREHFHCFKENEGQFFLEAGFSYSCSLDLVPVVVPPLGLQVPYNILFKVNSLIQNGCLAGQTLDTTFFRLVHPQYVAIAHIERALETLYHLKECCYEPVKWLNEQYKRYGKLKNITDSPFVALDYGLVYIRRIQITPSKVYFCGPEAIVSNRVLRHYHELMDNFIRVSFVDEDWEKLRSTDLSPRTPSLGEDAQHTGIYSRILSVLRCGIAIGDKRFDFLAFSSSQLRDNSTWMFASENGITAAGIREWMGDFSHIRNVAKYAARLGQSFGSSTETLTVCRQEIQMIPDIEIEGNGLKFNFSDGIGKISEKFAKEVAAKCATNGSTPSAFQIRYGGFKGVVAVDPTSVVKLSLRDSMSKYTSLNSKLDVLSWSKFQPCFLNRQLITLLSTLGVKDQIFVKKQTEVINQLNMLLTDPVMAHQTLKIMSSREGVNVLKEMLFCGYKPDAEPFLSMMLQAFRASKLLDLRRKTRIFVPNGRSMMGCLDETGTLEYGQVFVQTSRANDKLVHSNCSVSGSELDLYNFIIVGKVLVAKNPCLHPGDVRILQAINVPDLHHLVDCVVFPQKGTRYDVF